MNEGGQGRILRSQLILGYPALCNLKSASVQSNLAQ